MYGENKEISLNYGGHPIRSTKEEHGIIHELRHDGSPIKVGDGYSM